MLVIKVAPVFLLFLVVGAEKKIELQDIEEDNLKSEKEKELEKNEARTQTSGPGSGPGLLPLEFLKSGLLRYFETPPQAQQAQQPRYVQQYAVTEQPERPPESVAQPKPQYGPPGPQQAMVGYLSNVPMQIYLVPQYYNEPSEQAASPQAAVQYSAPTVGRVAYPTAPESVQPQTNYIEVPTYVAPTGKAYIQPYSSPVTYVTYAQPTVAPAQSTVGPVVYQMPLVQYPTAIVSPPTAPKGYYQHYTDTNAVEEDQNEVESPKQYVTQSEPSYNKPTAPEYPRYYNSRTPLREDHRHSSPGSHGSHGPISELPPPNPLLLKGPPPHLAHLPKALPMYRPLSKPIYAAGGNLLTNSYIPRPSEAYGAPFKRRPNSLLDSYIPSSLQVEYLKRGYTKDPLAAYEALSSGRHFQNTPGPRHYERGFLPNQMYHTAAGGITYGHYKRTPKVEKVPQK
ncbi:uncharacterized protein LOC126373471 [Pectinophora gossypiella]|uniref:uncharacterized protein LOC126373471 n=1 Tax=Pectinophora gossypiella TaxID=13191 RepID=UPI00214ECD6A|nr:uncharacterized protein LOC126373471 [Pectinophora gossypiella]